MLVTLAISGCRVPPSNPCREAPLPEGENRLPAHLDGVRWTLHSIDGKRSKLDSPGWVVYSFDEHGQGGWASHDGCNRVWSRAVFDGAVVRVFGVESTFLACSHHRPRQRVPPALRESHAIAVRDGWLAIQSPSGKAVYRSNFAAEPRESPLPGTWEIVDGPDPWLTVRLRLRFAPNRRVRARYDCDPPAWCRLDGRYGLSDRHDGLELSLFGVGGHQPGGLAFPKRMPIEVEANSLELVTNAGAAQFRRIDCETALAEGDAPDEF